MKVNRILWNSGGGGGGGATPAWVSTLPEDMRGESMLHMVPDVPTLAKNYLHAQRLVGTDRVPVPQATWNEQQYNEFYNKIGRPEKAEGYKAPTDLQLEQGLELKPELLQKAFGEFHKMGLTAKQAESVIRYYAGTQNETVKGSRTAAEQSRIAAETSLKQEFGDKYDLTIETAKAAVRRFGDDELVKHLTESGLGNHPSLIKAFAKIGSMTAEDMHRGGGSMPLSGPTAAQAEINKLIADADFMKTFMNKGPGHDEAVQRWEHLHKVAYPGQQMD